MATTQDTTERPLGHIPLSKKNLARFFSKISVNPQTGCWEWIGALHHSGRYALLTYRYRSVRAHQVSYLWFVGEIPEGMEPDHLCRVRHCVAPFHLEAVTHQVNVLRGEAISAKYARRTHCARGHELTPENLLHLPSRKGYRNCRLCIHESLRRYREKGEKPEVKEHRKEYARQYKQRPEVKEREREAALRRYHAKKSKK